MQLGKILEEIDLKIAGSMGKKREGLLEAENIIRKHLSSETAAETTRSSRDNDGWISVDERLPENAKHKGVFCPKYQVNTKYGVTEGWYNPDVKSWYCLFWFMAKRYLEHEIDFAKGDVPKVVRVPLESDIVIAWRPLPEPYYLEPEAKKPNWRENMLRKFDRRER